MVFLTLFKKVFFLVGGVGGEGGGGGGGVVVGSYRREFLNVYFN